MTPPKIVSTIRHTLAQAARDAHETDTELPSFNAGMDDMSLPLMPMDFSNQNLPYTIGMQDGSASMGPEMSFSMPGQVPSDGCLTQQDWTAGGGWPDWRGF